MDMNERGVVFLSSRPGRAIPVPCRSRKAITQGQSASLRPSRRATAGRDGASAQARQDEFRVALANNTCSAASSAPLPPLRWTRWLHRSATSALGCPPQCVVLPPHRNGPARRRISSIGRVAPHLGILGWILQGI